MAHAFKPSRRRILTTGIASLAATATAGRTRTAFAAPVKQPGETKIVCVMGDYWHPAISQETHVRQIFSKDKSYRVYFVLASRYLTAELLSDADLFISARYGGGDSLGWVPDPIVVDRPRGDTIWTDEHLDALFDNVTKRGMGWIAAHCTLANGRERLQQFMGMVPLLHQEVQPLGVHDLNPDHPITRGIPEFFINLDEQFAIELTEPDNTDVLFKTKALHDKRETVAGWAIQRGKGRIVGLLPGHYQWNYRVPEYQDIFWRAAHWAMQRDIPPYNESARY